MILRICVSSLLLLIAARSNGVESYSQVSTSGSNAGSGPKVFKAMNMDLIYPRTFNSSENVISTTEVQPSTQPVEPILPVADDQLTPEDNSSSEEMIAQSYSQDNSIPVASNYPPTFVFPSNHADELSDSQTTPPPMATGRAVDYSSVPPISQLLKQNNNGYRPTSTAYRPAPKQRFFYSNYQSSGTPSRAEMYKQSGKGQSSGAARADGYLHNLGGGEYHYQSPKTPSDAVDMVYPPPMMRKVDTAGPPPAMMGMNVPKPAPPMDSGMMKNGMMQDSGPPADHHDHHDIMGYEEDKEYPTPPPGYMEEHDHDHPHFQGHDYPDHDHYHDVVYDDHHHDEHDHPMTEPPPPPPPPAPAHPHVKKFYSYFYIGRKMWYIQLYFILWFTCYVLWMIIKSIGRHKVNLPNHYARGIDITEVSHREAREAIDKITLRIMDGIEKFKMKHLG